MPRPRGTDGSLLSSLPWTLAALAVSLAAHVMFLPIWITGALIFCGSWRYLIERRRRPLPPVWFRAGLALSCFLGVIFSYGSISGVGPGSALLAIMAAMKLLETRKRRDQFVLLFISIFLVMSSLLREQYLWSLPYMLVALLLIMTAWLYDRLAAHVGRRSGNCAAELQERWPAHSLRGASGNRHVDILSAYCDAVLGSTNRYERRRFRLERYYEPGRYQFPVTV
jgi:hypothetical protein